MQLNKKQNTEKFNQTQQLSIYGFLPQANPLQPQQLQKLNTVFSFVEQLPSLVHSQQDEYNMQQQSEPEDCENVTYSVNEQKIAQTDIPDIHQIGSLLSQLFKDTVYQSYQELNVDRDNYNFATLQINITNQTQLSPAIRKTQALINCNKQILKFESRFQSGNLALAALDKGDIRTYNLALQRDTNSKATTQWYFFSIENSENTGTYTFNIVNFTKSYSTYSKGMKPCIYSTIQAQSSKPKKIWRRGGDNISYKQNSIIYWNKKKYYTLKFSYTFTDKNDKVYFAYCYPYTFSMLQNYLYLKQSQNPKIMKNKVLTKTIGGNPIQLITITETKNNNLTHSISKDTTDESQETNKQLEDKAHRIKQQVKDMIFISARVHPGQTVSSYVCEGLIDFLLGKSQEAENIRRLYTIKIVPMLNPDGVIHGNYRTSLIGADLNRRWKRPDKQLHSEIYYVKKYLTECEYKKTLFIDLHGHSKKKASFMYGCLNRQNPYLCKEFPFLLSKNGYHFNYYNCNFSTPISKEGTSRITVWKELKVDYSYTMEMSFYGPTKSKTHFKINDYKKIGTQLGKVMSIYFCGKLALKSNLPAELFETFYKDMSAMKYGEQSSDGSESGEEQVIQEQLATEKLKEVASKITKSKGELSNSFNKQQLIKYRRTSNQPFSEKKLIHRQLIQQNSTPYLRTRKQSLNLSHVELQKINIGTQYQIFSLNTNQISQEFKTQRNSLTKPCKVRNAYRPYSYTKNKLSEKGSFHLGKYNSINNQKGSVMNDQSLILPRVVRKQQKSYNLYRNQEVCYDAFESRSFEKPPYLATTSNFNGQQRYQNNRSLSKKVRNSTHQISLGDKIHMTYKIDGVTQSNWKRK